MKQKYGSHNRRSIRSKGYNYSIAGAYFATICAHNREYISGDVLVVMPNHLHGILEIVDVGATRRVAPTNVRLTRPIAGSIGAIGGQFKSIVTKRINTLRSTPGLLIWQRKYYELIIRNEDKLNPVPEYILENPLHRQFGVENPGQIKEKIHIEMM